MPTLPSTPALPRFADESLLFETQPIFDADVSFNVDWLEPLTPKAGPSRLRNIETAQNEQSVAWSAEEGDLQDVLDRTLLEESVLSGRGERLLACGAQATQSSPGLEPEILPRPSDARRKTGNTATATGRSPRKHLQTTRDLPAVAPPARPAQHHRAPPFTSITKPQISALRGGKEDAPTLPQRPLAPTNPVRRNRTALGETVQNGQTKRAKPTNADLIEKLPKAMTVPGPAPKKSALSRYLAKAAQDRPCSSDSLARAEPSTMTRLHTRQPSKASAAVPPASDHGSKLPSSGPSGIAAGVAQKSLEIDRARSANTTSRDSCQGSLAPARTLGPAAEADARTDDDELEVHRERIVDDRMDEPLSRSQTLDDLEMLPGSVDNLVDSAPDMELLIVDEDQHITRTPPSTPIRALSLPRALESESSGKERSADLLLPETDHRLTLVTGGPEEFPLDAEGREHSGLQAATTLASGEQNGKKRARESLLGMVTGFLRRSTSSLSLRGESKESEGEKEYCPATMRAGQDSTEQVNTAQLATVTGTGGPTVAECSPPRKMAKQSHTASSAAGMRPRPPVSGYISLTRPLQPRLPPSPPGVRQRSGQAVEAPLRMAQTHTAARLPLRPSRSYLTGGSNVRPMPLSTHDKGSSAAPTRKPPVPKVGVRAQNLTAKPTSTSAFAAAALARLPPPGKGASAAAAPVRVKTPERARDLARRRSVFEASASMSAAPRPRQPPLFSDVTHSNDHKANTAMPVGLARTEPVRGHTPGKASRARAERREAFDAGLRARNEEKDRVRREEQKRREEEEERAYLQRRKETVIWAKGVPEMYRRGGGGNQEVREMGS